MTPRVRWTVLLVGFALGFASVGWAEAGARAAVSASPRLAVSGKELVDLCVFLFGEMGRKNQRK
jgi:hypothetical protein